MLSSSVPAPTDRLSRTGNRHLAVQSIPSIEITSIRPRANYLRYPNPHYPHFLRFTTQAIRAADSLRLCASGKEESSGAGTRRGDGSLSRGAGRSILERCGAGSYSRLVSHSLWVVGALLTRYDRLQDASALIEEKLLEPNAIEAILKVFVKSRTATLDSILETFHKARHHLRRSLSNSQPPADPSNLFLPHDPTCLAPIILQADHRPTSSRRKSGHASKPTQNPQNVPRITRDDQAETRAVGKSRATYSRRRTDRGSRSSDLGSTISERAREGLGRFFWRCVRKGNPHWAGKEEESEEEECGGWREKGRGIKKIGFGRRSAEDEQ